MSENEKTLFPMHQRRSTTFYTAEGTRIPVALPPAQLKMQKMSRKVLLVSGGIGAVAGFAWSLPMRDPALLTMGTFTGAMTGATIGMVGMLGWFLYARPANVSRIGVRLKNGSKLYVTIKE